MRPVVNNDGTILNAAVLRVGDVSKKRVLCPACGQKVFEMWPEGWDAHAATKCAGLTATDAVTRKKEVPTALEPVAL